MLARLSTDGVFHAAAAVRTAAAPGLVLVAERGLATAAFAVSALGERFDRRGTEPFELFRSEFVTIFLQTF